MINLITAVKRFIEQLLFEKTREKSLTLKLSTIHNLVITAVKRFIAQA